MAEKQQSPKVDGYIRKHKEWQEEFKALRSILLDTALTEDFKWMHPCYTFDGDNIVIVQDFKDYCALMFVKGVLLKDPEGILIAMTENTQSSRQIRFTSAQQVTAMEPIIKAYVQEAIAVEKSGLEVPFKDTSDYDFPDELVQAFEEDPEFEEAFQALTPGRQRGYLLHFSGAKQSKTRASRIEKSKEKIFDGKGHNER